jgi:hypothetical protein
MDKASRDLAKKDLKQDLVRQHIEIGGVCRGTRVTSAVGMMSIAFHSPKDCPNKPNK